MQWSLVMVVVGTQKKKRLMKGQLKDRARKWLPPLPEATKPYFGYQEYKLELFGSLASFKNCMDPNSSQTRIIEVG